MLTNFLKPNLKVHRMASITTFQQGGALHICARQLSRTRLELRGFQKAFPLNGQLIALTLILWINFFGVTLKQLFSATTQNLKILRN